MSYMKEDGTALKMWEGQNMPGVAGAYLRAVPGGWSLSECGPDGFQAIYIPDPFAPHCQPTPPAGDRPPMTDDALRAWLTATYGEPNEDGEWEIGSRIVVHSGHDREREDSRWLIDDTRKVPFHWMPASIAGPALHAAHRYGNP